MGSGYDVKITVLQRFDPAEVFEKVLLRRSNRLRHVVCLRIFKSLLLLAMILKCLMDFALLLGSQFSLM